MAYARVCDICDKAPTFKRESNAELSQTIHKIETGHDTDIIEG